METIKENINGKSRVVATFDIDWDNMKKPVKIKKLNFGEYNEIQKAAMKITMFTGQPKMDIDPVVMNEQAILRSIVDAPFPINDLVAIRELDREVAELILFNVNELNMPSEKKIS